MLFSQATTLTLAIPLMITFAMFVKMSNGATYAVVPFINRRALGAVSGIVGAGGNAGAVAAGFLVQERRRSIGTRRCSSRARRSPCVSFLAFPITFRPETEAANRSSRPTVGEFDGGGRTGRIAGHRRKTGRSMISRRSTSSIEPARPSSSSATAWSASASASGWSSSTAQREFRIVTFCEEPRAAYDRVGLTSFFAHRDAEKLMLARQEWYAENGVELHLGDRANRIDRQQANRALGPRSGNCVRPRRAGHRIVSVRAAGAGHRQAGRVRLSHDRRLAAHHRICRHVEALRGDRRRTAGTGSRQGGVRPRPGNARRRVCPATDAAPGRRCRFANSGAQDRIARRAGALGQVDQGDSWQWLRRADRIQRRRSRSTST